MLKDDLIAWSVEVERLYSDAKSYIDNHKLPAMPDYDNISNRKGLYEAYSNIIVISNSISELLSSVVRMSMLKINFKRLIKSEGYGPSVMASMNTIVDEVSEKVTIIDKLINTYKVAVDNQIRFYQAIQYILGSPRLSTMG